MNKNAFSALLLCVATFAAFALHCGGGAKARAVTGPGPEYEEPYTPPTASAPAAATRGTPAPSTPTTTQTPAGPIPTAPLVRPAG